VHETVLGTSILIFTLILARVVHGG
jgi:hypothetical protein